MNAAALTVLLQNDGLSPATIVKYLGVLKVLGGQYTDLSFLANTDTILQKVRRSFDTAALEHTQKGRLTAIMSVLRIIDAPKELYDIYRTEFDKLYVSLNTIELSGEKNDKQRAYHLTAAEVDAITAWLSVSATCIDNLPFDRLNYLIWSLYTKIPPRRTLDYHMCDVVATAAGAASKERNYYIVDQALFVFNIHKRYRTTGTETISIATNPDMLGIMTFYLRNEPNGGIGRPLLAIRGERRVNRNLIGARLSKICGKPMGSNSMRHIYAENHGPSRASLDTLLSDAKKMGHSLEVHIRTYMKTMAAATSGSSGVLP